MYDKMVKSLFNRDFYLLLCVACVAYILELMSEKTDLSDTKNCHREVTYCFSIVLNESMSILDDGRIQI